MQRPGDPHPVRTRGRDRARTVTRSRPGALAEDLSASAQSLRHDLVEILLMRLMRCDVLDEHLQRARRRAQPLGT